MWYDNLLLEIEKMKDEEQAVKMAAYMKNKFSFIGIPKTVLKPYLKPYLKENKKFDLDWNFVYLCWEKEYREAQYVAIEYININSQKLKACDLDKIKQLIISKSWWESVDMLDSSVGVLVKNYPELKKVMLEWSLSDNIWLKRTAIDFQLKYKEDTDTLLLEEIIKNNLGSTEFFINKAIGWSLREYSKVNSHWVREFINRYRDELSNLSIKEGSKYL